MFSVIDNGHLSLQRVDYSTGISDLVVTSRNGFWNLTIFDFVVISITCHSKLPDIREGRRTLYAQISK